MYVFGSPRSSPLLEEGPGQEERSLLHLFTESHLSLEILIFSCSNLWIMLSPNLFYMQLIILNIYFNVYCFFHLCTFNIILLKLLNSVHGDRDRIYSKKLACVDSQVRCAVVSLWSSPSIPLFAFWFFVNFSFVECSVYLLLLIFLLLLIYLPLLIFFATFHIFCCF